MESYQERVVKEKRDLDASIKELSLFLGSDRAESWASSEMRLLKRQLHSMSGYSTALGERIEGFERGNAVAKA